MRSRVSYQSSRPARTTFDNFEDRPATSLTTDTAAVSDQQTGWEKQKWYRYGDSRKVGMSRSSEPLHDTARESGIGCQTAMPRGIARAYHPLQH
jgi:hypothetical protein